MTTRPGWVVFPEDVNATHGRDYRRWSDAGFGVIVRLNWGYGETGTIPLPARYDQFATMCGEFVVASRGCTRWIIGNEPNHEQERPQGQPITPELYADCFRRCAVAIISSAGDGHELIPAAIAPWNERSGDWLDYFRRMLDGCQDYADGIALHTYTHGSRVELITSEAKMQPPYDQRRFEFRAYRDFLAVVPAALRKLPVYVTETDQDDPWLDVDNGWVQAAYYEIDQWNKLPGTQKIHCLALYRWPKLDQWSIEDKRQVQEMFRQAVYNGYHVPGEPVYATEEATVTQTFGSPLGAATYGDAATIADPVAREWDSRLTGRGVAVEETAVEFGKLYWALVRGQWFDKQQSGGRYHIYVETIDEDGKSLAGVRFRVTWPSGAAVQNTNGRSGFDAGNYPMSASRNEFSVVIADGDNGLPSDRVVGIGMGADIDGSGFNPAEHTSTLLVFQRRRLQRVPASTEPTPVEQPVPAPVPVATGIVDPRVAGAILDQESGSGGFDQHGRLKRRVEAHLLLGATYGNPAVMAGQFRYDEANYLRAWYRDEAGNWVAYHDQLQSGEQAAFDLAYRLDPEAAMRCTSIGASQVMGFNHATLGFSTVAAMYAAFEQSEHQHTLGFLNYCLAKPGLVEAINARDWPTIGRLYNGAASAGEKYRAAYVRLWGES